MKLIIQVSGMSYFLKIICASSKLWLSMSTTSRIMFLPSNFLIISGIKLPTPTDGSRILTVSLSVSGRTFIISVINVLLVKKAALSVRFVFANSAILPSVDVDKFIGLSETNFFKTSALFNPLDETILLIAAVLSGSCFNEIFIFLAMD